jgi:hypothetical protein
MVYFHETIPLIKGLGTILFQEQPIWREYLSARNTMLYNALVGKMDDRKTNNYIFGDPV